METKIVVCAVIEQDGKILLVRKPGGVPPYPDTWHIPGGKVRNGESIINALKREIKEETNLDLEEISPFSFDEDIEPNKHGERTHFVFLQFSAKPKAVDATPGDDVEKCRWVKKDELSLQNLNRPTVSLLRKLNCL